MTKWFADCWIKIDQLIKWDWSLTIMSWKTVGKILLCLINLERKEKNTYWGRGRKARVRNIFNLEAIHCTVHTYTHTHGHMHTNWAVSSSLRLEFRYNNSCLVPVELVREERRKEETQWEPMKWEEVREEREGHGNRRWESRRRWGKRRLHLKRRKEGEDRVVEQMDRRKHEQCGWIHVERREEKLRAEERGRERWMSISAMTFCLLAD